MSHTILHLHKENFKFSAAHFLIFNEHEAERLHGHNYQVKVQLVPDKVDFEKTGFFVDFNVFKKFIKQRLDHWDEMVLLPAKHPDIKVSYQVRSPKLPRSLEVHFRERFYVFPENEVHLLPITNTSVEQLSLILAQDFIHEFKKYGVRRIMVRVEETRGQGATSTLDL